MIKQAHFSTLDDYMYQGHMYEDWTPKSSQILTAHKLGFTNQQYIDYMTDVAMGRKDAFQMVKKQYTDEEVVQQRRRDDLHFQKELKQAGYNPLDGYAAYETGTAEPVGVLARDTNPETVNYDKISEVIGDKTKPVVQEQSPQRSITLHRSEDFFGCI